MKSRINSERGRGGLISYIKQINSEGTEWRSNARGKKLTTVASREKRRQNPAAAAATADAEGRGKMTTQDLEYEGWQVA